MAVKREQKKRGIEIKFWLTPEQAAALDCHIKPFGGHRGPYARQLILRELAAQEAREAKEAQQ